jgi:hypothetical protein
MLKKSLMINHKDLFKDIFKILTTHPKEVMPLIYLKVLKEFIKLNLITTCYHISQIK